MRPMFEVYVSNIGCVERDASRKKAERAYSVYVESSKASHGRASGESVLMLLAGDVVKEYNPEA